MCGKKLSLFFVVLVLVLCSVSAFSFTKKPKMEIDLPKDLAVVEATMEETVEEETVTQQQLMELSPLQSESLMELSQTLEGLEHQSKLNKNEIVTIVGDLKIVQEGIEIMKADIIEKQEIIDELSELNAKQADDIAYLQGRYDKEIKGSKFFANVGGVFGMMDENLMWGVTGNVGVRLFRGFLVGAGANYMVGTFNKGFMKPSLNNLSLNATIGWEW